VAGEQRTRGAAERERERGREVKRMHRSCGRLSGVSSSAGVCAAAARRGLPASRRRGGLAQQQHNASVLAPRRVGPRASTEGSSSVLDNLDNLALVKKVALSGKVFQQISAREMFEALIAINQIKSKKPENLSKGESSRAATALPCHGGPPP